MFLYKIFNFDANLKPLILFINFEIIIHFKLSTTHKYSYYHCNEIINTKGAHLYF